MYLSRAHTLARDLSSVIQLNESIQAYLIQSYFLRLICLHICPCLLSHDLTHHYIHSFIVDYLIIKSLFHSVQEYLIPVNTGNILFIYF